MRTIVMLSGFLTLTLSTGAWGLEAVTAASSPPQEGMAAAQPAAPSRPDPGPFFRAVDDQILPEVEDEGCSDDADADAIACPPKVCTCNCGAAVVTVTIFPARHGETCAGVTGRPCNLTTTPVLLYTGCV
jgi:hypothetical protein